MNKIKLFSIYIILLAGLFLAGCSKDELIPANETVESSSRLKAGRLAYKLVKVSNPTADQTDAYNRITAAMNAACSMYNGQGISVTRTFTVYYSPGVPTAQANINGQIWFGSNRSYMTQCTAMHEIGHCLGVGTSSRWPSLMVNGVWIGPKATAMLRSMVGESPTAVIHGDRTHFWPYGLNYNSEWSTVNGQRHARIVNAMILDGN